MVGIELVEPAEIPVIDFQALSAGTPPERKAALKQLDDAFQSVGLIHLANHSIGQDLIEEAFSWVLLSILTSIHHHPVHLLTYTV